MHIKMGSTERLALLRSTASYCCMHASALGLMTNAAPVCWLHAALACVVDIAGIRHCWLPPTPA
jgi:hypothetical protein